jgi:membrane protein implicated in regulation of membrane protease activity
MLYVLVAPACLCAGGTWVLYVLVAPGCFMCWWRLRALCAGGTWELYVLVAPECILFHHTMDVLTTPG